MEMKMCRPRHKSQQMSVRLLNDSSILDTPNISEDVLLSNIAAVRAEVVLPGNVRPVPTTIGLESSKALNIEVFCWCLLIIKCSN